MKRVIGATLLGLALAGCEFGDTEYHNEARVLEVKNCIGERYDVVCLVKVKLDNGQILDRPVSTMAYEGQRLYRMCWIEGDGSTWCMGKLRTSIVAGYGPHESEVK